MKYKNTKVLVLGLGVNEGGLGATRFFAKQRAEVRVTDLKNEEELKPSLEQLKEFKNIKFVLGKHYEKDLDWADLIVKNPAIKPNNPFLKYALAKGKIVEMDLGIFLEYVNPEQIIGVTGSKGKTTTCHLIYSALKSKYPDTVLAGNIGKSVLDTVDKINKDTLVILELSSFQLEAFEQHQISPHFAVITNIFPEHLNYYDSMVNYISAKRIIAKYQTGKDYLFLNQDDQLLNSKEFLDGLKGQVTHFSPANLPENFIPTLKGEHNKASYSAALAIAKGLNIPEEKALVEMNKFQGAEFRMQLVKDYQGVLIYNDTTATNPNATIEALKTFKKCILICGGMNKGLEYQDLAKAIEEYAKSVYFLEGDATEIIISNIKYQMSKIKGKFNNLEDLLSSAKKGATSGDVILFSPGATSFNLFQNEFDRGRKFNQAVEKVFS